MSQSVDIPIDVYDSTTEFLIVMPLWGVAKKSVHLTLKENVLTINGERVKPEVKPTLMPMSEGCFWWPFTKSIELPANSYFNNIHSELSPENILFVVVPKVIVPEEITVHIS